VGYQYYPIIQKFIEDAVGKRTLKPQFHDSVDLEIIDGIDSRIFHEQYNIPFIHFGLALDQRQHNRNKKLTIPYDSLSEKYFLKVLHYIVDVVDHLDKKLALFNQTYQTQKENLQRENKRRIAKFEKDKKEKQIADQKLDSTKNKLAEFRARFKKPKTTDKSPNRRKVIPKAKQDSKDMEDEDDKEEEEENKKKIKEQQEKEKQAKEKQQQQQQQQQKQPDPSGMETGIDEDSAAADEWGDIPQ